MFKIESGVPVAPKAKSKGGGRPAIYPFKEMKAGDSFLFSCSDDEKSERIKRLRNAGNKALGPGAIVCRKVDGGVRVWRTK